MLTWNECDFCNKKHLVWLVQPACQQELLLKLRTVWCIMYDLSCMTFHVCSLARHCTCTCARNFVKPGQGLCSSLRWSYQSWAVWGTPWAPLPFVVGIVVQYTVDLEYIAKHYQNPIVWCKYQIACHCAWGRAKIRSRRPFVSCMLAPWDLLSRTNSLV